VVHVPRARLTVVPAGVDSIRFSPEGPAVDRDPDRPRILGVGRLVERKGFGDVIEALRLVPSAEVVVVGGPPADQLPADPGARSLRALAEKFQVAAGGDGLRRPRGRHQRRWLERDRGRRAHR
jgi:D-inositol-3-phosphate glycosyltransferase